MTSTSHVENNKTICNLSNSPKSASSKPQETNYFLDFRNNLRLEYQNEDDEKIGFFGKITKKIAADYREETVQNDARREISSLFKTIRDKNLQEDKSDRNKLYKSFQDIKNGELKNNKFPIEIHKNLKLKDNLPKLNMHFDNYCKFLFSKNENEKINYYKLLSGKNKEEKIARSKDIREKTTAFFKELLFLIPDEEPRGNGKNYLNIIISEGSEIVNGIVTGTQKDSVFKYFKACEQFVSLIFSALGLELLKDKIGGLVLSGLSCAGLLLTYQPRPILEKICIWAKRLFVVIGYVMHELCGVLLERLANPYIFSAIAGTVLGSMGAWISILGIAFIVGFAIVKLVDSGLNAALNFAERRSNKRLLTMIALIKAELDPTPNSASPRNEIHPKDAPLDKSAITEYFDNDTKVLNELFDKPIDTPSIIKYFNALEKRLDDKAKILNKLFYLQHKFMNSTLTKHEKKQLEAKVKKCLEEIEEKITLNPSNNVLDQEKFHKGITQYYSQLLASNSRPFFHNVPYYSAPLIFFGFDFAADTTGVVVTNKLEATNLDFNTKNWTEIFGSLLGAIPIVCVGILTHLSMSAISATCDKNGIQVPNKNIQNYVFQHLGRMRTSIEEKLNEIEKDVNNFRTAEKTRLLSKLREIDESIKRIKATGEKRDIDKKYWATKTPMQLMYQYRKM